MHKLHVSAKWKMANVSTGNVNTKETKLRVTHHEGRFDKSGMYRDWLYGNDRRLANIIGFLLTVMSIGIFFYSIQFLGSDKWDMPAPLLRKPDFVRRATEDAQKSEKTQSAT
ncbi:CzcA family heavy metal efflux pump [Perkinsela sp. CCAP 1560/4]|nr:CzcA family heavy metal efflux pump [Perkinsela sp. CCAP 1560/4]|eukprot:KNH04029.1 CzcA family heavy metal efflux pump [Perkinsela sp. CCAP 1560/4]